MSAVGNEIDINDLPSSPEINQRKVNFCDAERASAVLKLELEEAVRKLRHKCGETGHEFENIIEFDQSYCSRVDGVGRGQKIYIGRKCKKCKLFEPRRKGFPSSVCHKCGGDMRHDRVELCGQDRVHVNKCQSCGHEYDTT